MRPTVFIHEDQLRELPAGKVVHGVAFAWDDLTVVHAYAATPPGRPAGAPVACRLKRVPVSEFHAVSGAGATGDSSRVPGPEVFLLASADTTGVSVRAWLVRDGESVACDVKLIPGQSELFSRARGLLETDALARRTVAVVGVGSGGSSVAVDLAKSGVGGFVLVDPERLELANVSRHVCGVGDLGRFKTLAVRDAIHERNPHARVQTHEMDVNVDVAATARVLAGADVIIAATDGPRSRSVLNQLALALGIPAIFGRAITRAAGGDVLRVRPGSGPCLACVFAKGHMRAKDDEISTLAQGRRDAPDYVAADGADVFVQPGLAADIAPISNMITRLALLELSRGTTGEIASLAEDLQADLYFWVNRRERIYAGFPAMGFKGDRPSILRWYGVRASRDPACPECSDAFASDAPFEPEVYQGAM